MEMVDHKYTGEVRKTSDKSQVDTPWILFLAKDDAVPDTLHYYQKKCEELGASPEHVEGIRQLRQRVAEWRETHFEQCKTPD